MGKSLSWYNGMVKKYKCDILPGKLSNLINEHGWWSGVIYKEVTIWSEYIWPIFPNKRFCFQHCTHFMFQIDRILFLFRTVSLLVFVGHFIGHFILCFMGHFIWLLCWSFCWCLEAITTSLLTSTYFMLPLNTLISTATSVFNKMLAHHQQW